VDTQEQIAKMIEAWKEEYYGNVYSTEIEDMAFIWRGLTRAEYKKAFDWYDDDYDRAEYVCRQCVLFPEIDDWGNEMYAGIPETITENILKESGFTLSIKELDAKIWAFEQEMQTFDNQISCIVKEAFPDIPLEEIENWQFEKLLWYYSRAKWTLENLRGLEIKREDQQNQIPGLPPMG
jgi:hypothetical protein